MKTLFKKMTLFMAALFVTGLLAGCSLDGGVNTTPTPDPQNTGEIQEPTTSEGQGTLVLGLSNEGFNIDGYSEFYVSIDNIEVYTAAEERVMVDSFATEVDLVALQNTEYAIWIGEEDLDLATVSQVRFDLSGMSAMQGDTEINFEDINDVELPIQAIISENQYTYVLLDLQGTQADIQMDSEENYYFSPTVDVTVVSSANLFVEEEGGEDRVRSDGGTVAGEFTFSLRVYNQIEINEVNDDEDIGTGTIIDLDADTNVDGTLDGTIGNDGLLQ